MPTIREMLPCGNGMRYATALDQILSYYSISIKKKIQKLLTIIMPWGKYMYTKMPNGFEHFSRHISERND